MNPEVLLLYSDHSNACLKFKTLLNEMAYHSQNIPELTYIISNIRGVNIDSDAVKKIITESKKINVKVVPTLLIVHPDNNIDQYEGKTAFDFIKQYTHTPEPVVPSMPTRDMSDNPSSTTNSYGNGKTVLDIDMGGIQESNIDINSDVSDLLASHHPIPDMTSEMTIEKMASGKPSKTGMQSMLEYARSMAKSREGVDKPIHTIGEVVDRQTPSTSLQIPTNLTELSGMV